MKLESRKDTRCGARVSANSEKKKRNDGNYQMFTQQQAITCLKKSAVVSVMEHVPHTHIASASQSFLPSSHLIVNYAIC